MVSIIIPCYNCAAFVGRAIESVLKQTLKDWELILVNNNSTDNTHEVLDYYRRTYPENIKCFIELKPGGPAARNTGLRYAEGEWIQFLDADDELLPDKIEKQLELATENQFDIIAGAYFASKMVDGLEDQRLRLPRSSNIWESLISSKLGITSANFWRKETLLCVDGWDENMSSSQEYDLLFRLLVAKARIGFDTISRTIIYSMENSVSNTSNKQRLERIMEDRVKLRLRMKSYLQEQGLFTPQLSSFFDLYLYNILIKRKSIIPEFVSKMLNTLSLKVPVKTKVKLNSKYFLKKLLGRKL